MKIKTDEELAAVLDSEINMADGLSTGTLSAQRRRAMEFYLGQPYGNEIEGRSQVVTSEVADTIEWILPSLLKIFTSSDKAVMFEPTGPEDEQAADQQTDVVNHVFYKHNPGFMVLYSLFKDALLSKRGFVKWFWNDQSEAVEETYEGLNQEELAALEADPAVTIEKMEEISVEDVAAGEPPPAPTLNVTVKRVNEKGQVKIVPMPPEEVLISKKATTIEDTPFIAHKVEKTVSELLLMGFDRKKVEALPSYNSDIDNEEAAERDTINKSNDDESEPADESMREVEFYECYLRYDSDDDGIAELHHIHFAGKTIFTNEIVDSIQIASATPVPITHEFFGQSVADLVMDIQKIKSTVLRNMLDNMYLQNNQRLGVNDLVNLDDALNNRAGGLVRVKGFNSPALSINPIPTQQLGQSAFQMLEYLDTIRESRTGTTRYNQGLDANSLNKTAHGLERIMSAAQQRIELIARIFAETGVKEMFLGIHELLLKHQDKEMVMRLRNKWTPINPVEWKRRENMTITVGLGTGDQEQKVMYLKLILEIQKGLMESGAGGLMVTPKQIYNALDNLTEATGLKNVESFFTKPDPNKPPKPEKPSPEEQQAQLEMKKTQQDMQIAQQELQMKQEEQRVDIELKRQKNQAEIEAMMIRADRGDRVSHG